MLESAQQPAHKAIPAHQTIQPDSEQPEELLEQTSADSAALIQQAAFAPRLLSPSSILQLQRTIGNKATQEMLAASRQQAFQKMPPRVMTPTAHMSTAAIQRQGNVAETAAGMEGKLNWIESGTKKKKGAFKIKGSTGSLWWKKVNNFARWVKGKGAFPKDNGNMNCWEAIVYSAIMAEAIEADAVKAAYAAALKAANDKKAEGEKDEACENAFNLSLGNWLGFGRGTAFRNGQEVAAGKLIMRGLDHVVIAVDSEDADGEWDGGTIVMSLGHIDQNDNKPRTTFTKTRLGLVFDRNVMALLKVVTPPWRNG
jgi:hypothetical protein